MRRRSPLLRGRWSPSAIFAFGLLAHVEDQAGFLPPPSLALSHYTALPKHERASFAVAAVYHTAYVMGLLTAAILLRRHSPPAAVPPSRRHRGAAAEILDLMDADAPVEREARHWRDALAELSKRQRDAVAPLLLTICLRRAMTACDLLRLRAALQIAARHDLVRAPAPLQALALLKRTPHLASLTTQQMA